MQLYVGFRVCVLAHACVCVVFGVCALCMCPCLYVDVCVCMMQVYVCTGGYASLHVCMCAYVCGGGAAYVCERHKEYVHFVLYDYVDRILPALNSATSSPKKVNTAQDLWL